MLPPAVRLGKCPAQPREGGCLEHLPFPVSLLCLFTLLLLWLPRAAPRACGGRDRSLRGSSHHTGRNCIIKGCHLAAEEPRSPTPRFRLCLDPRGLQPWCLEEVLSSQEPGAPALAHLHCDMAGVRAPTEGAERNSVEPGGKHEFQRLKTTVSEPLTPLPPTALKSSI